MTVRMVGEKLAREAGRRSASVEVDERKLAADGLGAVEAGEVDLWALCALQGGRRAQGPPVGGHGSLHAAHPGVHLFRLSIFAVTVSTVS